MKCFGNQQMFDNVLCVVMTCVLLCVGLCEGRSSRKHRKHQDPCEDCSRVSKGENIDEYKNTCRSEYVSYVNRRCGGDHILDSAVDVCEPCGLTCLATSEEFKQITIYSEEDCIAFCGRVGTTKKFEAAAHGGSETISVRIKPRHGDSEGSGPYMSDDEGYGGSGSGMAAGMGPIQGHPKKSHPQMGARSGASDEDMSFTDEESYIKPNKQDDAHVANARSSASSKHTNLTNCVCLIVAISRIVFIIS